MYDTKTIRRHANLFTSMAESEGVDLEEAVLRADITPDEVVDGVLKCTGCSEPDACEAALAQKTAPTGVPSYCRNAKMIEALKRGT